MLYKMHLSREEIKAIHSALRDYLDINFDGETEAAKRAETKIGLLEQYVELSSQVVSTMNAAKSAKAKYAEFTFHGKLPDDPLECDA